VELPALIVGPCTMDVELNGNGPHHLPSHLLARLGGPTKNCFQLVRLKTKRSRCALIGNVALRVDQVNAVRPALVGLFGRVAKLVEHSRKLYAKLSHAGTGDEGSVFFRPRAGKNDVVFDIALHLPNVAGLRFRNIDDQESNTTAIRLVKLIEGGSLPPERRSSVPSEHKHHGLPLVYDRELNTLAFVYLEQREVWRRISQVQTPPASMHPQCFKREEQKDDGAGHSSHHGAESLRRLTHRPPDVSSERDVADYQAD